MSKEFSIDKACQYLITKAYPSYNKDTCGYCAKAIRGAVDFGLNGKHVEKKLSAKDYGPSYEKVGFKKVYSNSGNPNDIKDYIPQIGDICIIQYEPHGHICMFTQKGWVSDFIQRDMYGGKIREKKPAFDIYRFC